jgi:hypothetical protein
MSKPVPVVRPPSPKSLFMPKAAQESPSATNEDEALIAKLLQEELDMNEARGMQHAEDRPI